MGCQIIGGPFAYSSVGFRKRSIIRKSYQNVKNCRYRIFIRAIAPPVGSKAYTCDVRLWFINRTKFNSISRSGG